MDQKIFRKKSLDKINSPESLNDYIRVSNPGVWLILCAVVFFLAGILIWGFFGHIDSTVKTVAEMKSGEGVCMISENDISLIKENMIIDVDGKEGKVKTIGEFNEKKDNYTVYIEADVKDGTYPAEIVTERVKPASFVLN